MGHRSGTARRRGGFLATIGAAIVALAPIAAAPAASADIPDVDEIVTSTNVQHLANVPKQPPFDVTSAFGSDVAFQGGYAFAGNYGGFVVYDIRNPTKPEIASQVVCPGGQNDVSVGGDLLFLSTDHARTNDSCQSQPTNSGDPDGWEGIKIFDISDKRNPRYVAAIPTKCGSHTHTLVPGKTGESVYVYVSSYDPNEAFPNCQPPHDLISIIKVPRDDPAAARVVAEPVLFPDGGNPGEGNGFPEHTSATSGCHDITAYPDKDIAAGACMGDGILLDISDREQPSLIDHVQDDVNFAFWHSATFNNDATKIVFTDELGGGAGPTCNAEIGQVRGADGIYDVVGTGADRELVFRSYFKIPRHQADTENCVAHNGSLIPVTGRDIMVQGWYQGGVSIWEFTDSSQPEEIGYFERGPLSNEALVLGGSWSAYYYNGYVYSRDIQKGFDVLDIRDPQLRSAKQVRWEEFNAQTQQSYRD